MFAMDIGRNYARSHIMRAESIDLDIVRRLYKEMEGEASGGFAELQVAEKIIPSTDRNTVLLYVSC